MEQIAFFLPAAAMLMSGFLVVAGRNPVHSVLWLIAAFISGSVLMILVGAELFGMLLIVVYVGAVAVLFLFVMMMLDVKVSQIRRGLASYAPLGGVIAAVLFVEIAVLGMTPAMRGAGPERDASGVSNAEAISEVLFTEYFLSFQLAGLILLIAQIGAIVLTLRDRRRGIRHQDVSDQVGRRRRDAVVSVDVEPGQGV